MRSRRRAEGAPGPTRWVLLSLATVTLFALGWLATSSDDRPVLERIDDGRLLLTLDSGHVLAVEKTPIGETSSGPVYRGATPHLELSFDPPGEPRFLETRRERVPEPPTEPMGPVVYLGDVDAEPLTTFVQPAVDLPAPMDQALARTLGETLTCAQYAHRTTCTSADPNEPFLRVLQAADGTDRLLVVWIGLSSDAAVVTYDAESTYWQRVAGSSAAFAFDEEDFSAGRLTALDDRGNTLLETEVGARPRGR